MGPSLDYSEASMFIAHTHTHTQLTSSSVSNVFISPDALFKVSNSS